ncbi:MAG TPA: LPS assembly lipoprotein LptE [Ferruginibacter sp.]|nr:LPS assembly lipoprotein LptE [Ferruginibacter sp.]
MILKISADDRRQTTDDGRYPSGKGSSWSVVRGPWSMLRGQWSLWVTGVLLIMLFNFATCKYGFKDTSPIAPEVKTFRVNYLENRADYKNPQLSPALTEKLKQKIIGTTRLRQTNDDDAHYDISGYVSRYYTSTTGISGNNASLNRLTADFHLIFKNSLDEKKSFEADVTYSVDFNSNLSLLQVESQKGEEMVRNLSDAIFNKIFSNW